MSLLVHQKYLQPFPALIWFKRKTSASAALCEVRTFITVILCRIGLADGRVDPHNWIDKGVLRMRTVGRSFHLGEFRPVARESQIGETSPLRSKAFGWGSGRKCLTASTVPLTATISGRCRVE